MVIIRKTFYFRFFVLLWELARAVLFFAVNLNVMENFSLKEYVDNQLKFRLIQSEVNRKLSWRLLLNKEANWKGRTLAVFNLLTHLLPEKTVRRWRNVLRQKDLSKLPFKKDFIIHRVQLGEGFYKDVHLLEAKNKEEKSYVVKIEYSEGFKKLSLKEAEEIAQEEKWEYRLLREYYKIDDFIPEELVLLAEASRDGGPAVITLQAFAGYDLRDIFEEIDRKELKKKLLSNKKLRESFLRFVEKTDNWLTKKDIMVDLTGKKNIVLAVDENGRDVLKFLDPHSIRYFSEDKEERPERTEIFLKKLKYLKSIYKEVKNKE